MEKTSCGKIRIGSGTLRTVACASITVMMTITSNCAEAEAKTLDELRWIQASEKPIEVRGLPFFEENGGHWWRFPESSSAKVPTYVWETSKCSSGARLRFRTNSPQLAIRMTWQAIAANDNLSRFGAAALDVYVDGQYLRSIVPPDVGERTEWLFNGLAARERDVCLYLPLFSVVSVEALGFSAEAQVVEVAPLRVNKPIVFYGTSITHGGCAARPGLSYEAMLGRWLDADFVNFGMNGCGRGETEVARIHARVDASCFVLDFAQNNESPESLRANYLPFIETLRAAHPDTPILCVSPIYWTSELPGSESGSIHEQMRQVIRDAVRERERLGDHYIWLVEGQHDLLGSNQGDGLVDGLHPNTLGFYFMAKGLEPHLRKALHLTPPTE